MKQGAAYGYTQAARLPPDPRHPGRHARGAAHPAAQGVGEHAEGDQALLRGADRARRARRRDRRQAAARRLGVLEHQGLRAAGEGRLAVLDRRAQRSRTSAPAVEAIDEDAWQTIDYPDDGEAQIAETVYGGRRLIVRRTRLLGAQAELWPDWRHFAFITNRTEEITLVEAEHRDHAVVEQVIADLKDQALAHFPSGHFNANGAWTVLAALAHNLLRWTQLLGLPDTTVRAARTLRRRLLSIPGRLTRHARGWTLHLPARWPWHGDYINALNRIRALPAAA